jgi:hypothetical protein
VSTVRVRVPPLLFMTSKLHADSLRLHILLLSAHLENFPRCAESLSNSLSGPLFLRTQNCEVVL